MTHGIGIWSVAICESPPNNPKVTTIIRREVDQKVTAIAELVSRVHFLLVWIGCIKMFSLCFMCFFVLLLLFPLVLVLFVCFFFSCFFFLALRKLHNGAAVVTRASVVRPSVKPVFSEPFKQINVKFGGKVPFYRISKPFFVCFSKFCIFYYFFIFIFFFFRFR